MNKKKLDIKTLKYPSWFSVIFFILTILIPVSLVVIEGLKVPHTGFRVTFVIISSLVIAWFFIKKYIVDKIKPKLISKQVLLEHDYSIDNGNPVKIKYLWFDNEQKLAIFETISILLNGGLMTLILMGVATTFMKVRLILVLIIISYIVAYTIKFMLILVAKGDEYEKTDENNYN